MTDFGARVDDAVARVDDAVAKLRRMGWALQNGHAPVPPTDEQRMARRLRAKKRSIDRHNGVSAWSCAREYCQEPVVWFWMDPPGGLPPEPRNEGPTG